MAERRVFGTGPGMKPMSMAPAFGEAVYEIVIQTNARGLMWTKITKHPEGQPPTQMQLMGMFLDGLNGQFQAIVQSASMIVDANGKGLPSGETGNQEKSNNGNGGTTGNPGN